MKRLRILVAEDDALIAMCLAESLVALGHEVCANESSQQGTVTAALRSRPDLMIVDIGLGDGSGIAAVQEILKDGFVPHVFATGYGASLRQLGGEAIVIDKPFQEPQLARAIELAMAVHRPRFESVGGKRLAPRQDRTR